MNGFVWMLLTLALCGAALAQGGVPVPPLEFGDGPPREAFNMSYNNLGNRENTTPTFTLSAKALGAPAAKVWVRSAQAGLIVQGLVDGQAPQWATSRSDLLEKDHVEVWLAGATDVKLPPIGFGNQFGPETLETPADCTKAYGPSEYPGTDRDKVPALQADAAKKLAWCQQWLTQQVAYRKLLPRLFVRQWAFSGADYPHHGVLAEEFAGDAARQMDFVPDLLQPRQGVLADAAVTQPQKQPGRWHFEILIPWSAFPPLNHLAVKDLWLKVDVFARAPDGRRTGPFATSAPGGIFGRPITFNHIALQKPQEFAITPCHVGLTAADIYGDEEATWFMPPVETAEPSGELPAAPPTAVDFLIENPAGGYFYDPDGWSPEIQPQPRFWHTLGPGEAICGPKLAYRRSGKTFQYEPVLEREGFDVKLLPDGWLLVKSGPTAAPRSNFGSGQCGACPLAWLKVYTLSPTGKLESALQIDEEMEQPPPGTMASDFDFSADWQHATYFQFVSEDAVKGVWNSTEYCLRGHHYEACGAKSKVPEPPVRIKELHGEP